MVSAMKSGGRTSIDWAQYSSEVLAAIGKDEWWAMFGIPAGVIVVTQAVFLIPMFSKRPPRGERSMSLLLSLVIAAAVAAMLTFALMLGVTEFVQTVLEASLDLDDTLAMTVLVAALALAEERRWVLKTMGTADQREGMRAFLEKRKPVFNQG